MDTNRFLTPKIPSNPGIKGKLPHVKYRRIRANAEEVIRLRDELRWSDNRCALTLGFRVPGEFRFAYDLIKENGHRICVEGDWGGVEAAIYARFPDYASDPKFRDLLKEFNDPRVQPGGSLANAPLAPTRTPAPAPPAPLPASPAASPQDSSAAPVPAPRKRWGRTGASPETAAPATSA